MSNNKDNKNKPSSEKSINLSKIIQKKDNVNGINNSSKLNLETRIHMGTKPNKPKPKE